MSKLKLFNVAAILHPKVNDKGVDIGDSELILEPKTILAKSDKIAGQLVIREIDEKFIPDLDRVDVLVRPF